MVERKRRQHPDAEKQWNADGDEKKSLSEDDEEVGVEGLEQALVVGQADERVTAEVVEVLVRR